VWFSVVYLGEHYVLDVVAGVALAGTSWGIGGMLWQPRVAGRRLAVLRRWGAWASKIRSGFSAAPLGASGPGGAARQLAVRWRPDRSHGRRGRPL
ncbi:phosphatase PAP2 family protein, partial [Candidatus Nephthysia bennettiae]|nr:phosphatase PAP2 family protein [Candidatus Dormibacteraeota bacterium]